MITPAWRTLQIHGQPCLLCLVCNRYSFHPMDIQERYCGSCHLFLVNVPMDQEQPNTDRVTTSLGIGPRRAAWEREELQG